MAMAMPYWVGLPALSFLVSFSAAAATSSQVRGAFCGSSPASWKAFLL